MNLAIDMDGVLISNDEVWADHYNKNREKHGHVCEAGEPDSWDYFTNICKTCFHDCVHSHDIMARSPAMPGAKQGLRYLTLMGYTLHLVSHRAPNMRATAKQLLERHGLLDHFKSVEWSWAPKVETCERLGAFALIDDSPANLESLVGSGTAPIVFDHAYNRHLKHMRRVRYWKDVPDVVELAWLKGYATRQLREANEQLVSQLSRGNT